MTTLQGFPKFPDLPSELQGCIWHFAALDSYAPQQVSLLVVSKSTRPWVENILYENIKLTDASSTKSRLLFSSIAQRPDKFKNTTRTLWLIVYEKNDAPLALSAISTLHGLRKAFVYIEDTHLETLRCLQTLPTLREVRLDSAFNLMSHSQCSPFMQMGTSTNITHVVLGGRDHLGPHTLRLFSGMTNLAIISYKVPDLNSIQIWCDATPKSLQVFVLIDGWSALYRTLPATDAVHLGKVITTPSFTAKRVLFLMGRVPVLWDETALMWDTVNEAISSMGSAPAMPGSPFILAECKIKRK
ncbi:hypothetical protein DL96DRAFT_1609235 [Flagelloscypha sp. PMI_526]|nr:hypothetical protein DL96DRAFT_1609235 [Flagelloscypha sp. PMI_526]